MLFLFDRWVDIILVISIGLIGLGVSYGILMLVLSRFNPTAPNIPLLPDETSRKTVVFLLPCLNEEQVLETSLRRLLDLSYAPMHVLVVDDGSDDRTASVVQEFTDPRVHLLQRTLPDARLGKGEALNAAFAHLRAGRVVEDHEPSDVIVCVVDADGRLEPHTLDVVLPLFADADLGAVQIGVRINNRQRNLLARMQDLEFVLYTQVFQRGRRHLGSVGLGGNGQFVRLSALMSLGKRPWSRSLTEDLDLGVRLLLAGWRTEFASACAVHQQGLVGMRRWLRQRTRWFQGHLESWPLVPVVLSRARGARRADLLYHLTSPFLLLVTSLLSLAFILWSINVAIDIWRGTATVSWWWLSAYLVAFGPSLAFGFIYAAVEREHGWSLLKTFLVIHAYVAYALLWFVAGWLAVFRTLTGQAGWAKTARTTETEEEMLSSDPTAAPTHEPALQETT